MTFIDNTDEPTTDDAPAPADAAAETPDAEAPEAEASEASDATEPAAEAAPANIDPETGEVITADEAADAEVEATDAEDLLEEAAAPKPESPADRPGRWFVVHTQSGYEKKVKQNLEARTQSMNMEGRIHEVVIPMEDVVEFKNGKKVVVQKKMFPGYLLVRCHLDDDSWYVIRNTPGVTGFVGLTSKPSPLRRKEVETFLTVPVEGEEAPVKNGKPRLEFDQG